MEGGQYSAPIRKILKCELDKEHLIKELGDVAWYLAETAYALDIDLEIVFQGNIDKLKNRYPEGFDIERSKNRAEGDI